MASDMTTVIDDYVHSTHFLNNTPQEFSVCLGANSNANVRISDVSTTRVYIDSKYYGLWSEVLPPELQGAAVIDTDLQ